MKNGKLRVALVGVSFGAEFIPIYLKHPDVDSLVLVDTNEKLLNTVGDKFLLEERLTDFNAMLEDKTIDAVHLVTPPATHAPLSIQVMNAGKHCACTIPMGMSIDELYQVIDARKRSGKHYMFMETSVYGREFLYVKNLYEKGELGRIQFMRCAHYQDMEGWPDYWLGFPPLMHPTHAVAPCLMLLGKRPETVYCKGSGKVRKEVEAPYGCPYAFESALISLKDSDVSIEMARFLYHFPHRLGSYVMKRSVSVKFILTIAKSKEQNNRPLVESSLKTIFFFCLFSGFTQGELLFRGSKILNRKPSLLLTLTRERTPLYQERKNGNAAVVQKEKVRIKSLTQPMAFDG